MFKCIWRARGKSGELSVSSFETVMSQCPLICAIHSVVLWLKMMRRCRVLLLATFALVLLAGAPASAVFVGQGELPDSVLAENMVDLVRDASVQVNLLVDSVYVDDDVLQKIADAGLMVQLEENVSLYDQGMVLLGDAEVAIENADYDYALISAREALHVFRQVFKSVNSILLESGLRTGHEYDASNLLDAVGRTLERIARLREILPSNATDQFALLDEAEALLNLANSESLISEGQSSVVAVNLSQAKDLVDQVFQYLKVLAEESNTVRICGYLGEMGQVRERFRERFRYAEDQGMDMGSVFQSLGFQNETEFMNAFQNMIQTSQGDIDDFTAVMSDLEALGQMVQQMNQTLTQEMNRYQEQHGQGGYGNGAGSGGSETGSGSTDIGNGYGYGNVTSGNGVGSGLGGAAESGGAGSMSGSGAGNSSSEVGSGIGGAGVGGVESSGGVISGSGSNGNTSGTVDGNSYQGSGYSGAESGSPSGGSGGGAGGRG